MFLSLFTGVFGKYIAMGAGVIMLLASAFGYLKYKEYEATQAALASFNAQQLALTQKQNAEYQSKIDDLTKQAADLTVKNDQLNAIVDLKSVETVKYINSKKSTSVVDPLLNETLKRLNGGK